MARLIATSASSLILEISPPPGWRGRADGISANALAEIREFRARVLWSHGRRPAFRNGDGGYTDDDPMDLGSFHLVLRTAADRDLAGYVRAILPEHAPTSSVEELVGAAEATRLLAERGAGRLETLEVGRLVVAEGRQGKGVSPVLIGALLALGRSLGRSVLWCAAGMRGGQHELYSRLGYTMLAGHSRYSARYDDELCPMLCDTRKPVPGVDLLAERYTSMTERFSS